MSISVTSDSRLHTPGRILLVGVIAAFIGALQIALPSALYWADIGNNDRPPIISWRSRLRFNGFLNPQMMTPERASFASATICNNELIVLLKIRHQLTEVESFEIVRMNLGTGRVFSSAAPAGIRHLVSDGRQVWWLPGDSRVRVPFVLDGRPVAISIILQPQLLEFIDGQWRMADEFALAPDVFGAPDDSNGVVVLNQGENVYMIDHSCREIYYHAGLSSGTRERLAQFTERYPRAPWDWSLSQLQETGWQHIHYDGNNRDQRLGEICFDKQFGHWFERSLPCAMSLDTKNGISLWRFQNAGHPEVTHFVSPIRWNNNLLDVLSRNPRSTSWFHVFASADEKMRMLAYNGYDGRLHLLGEDNGGLRIVAQRGSPLIRWVIIDGAFLGSVAVLFPMAMLALIVWLVQPVRAQVYSFGHTSSVLATPFRRGVARAIDVTPPTILLSLSVFRHPDAFPWWKQVTGDLHDSIRQIVRSPDWGTVGRFQGLTSRLFTDLISAPFCWSLLVAAIAFLTAQIVWQARSGRTIGKWIQGIRVVRTTLRPCGLARSVLREFLFTIDSLMFLCWIPGFIAIFLTRDWQRIGDLVADTVVIRDSKANSLRSYESCFESRPY